MAAPPVNMARQERPSQVEQTISWETTDEGTLLLDDQTAVRRLRRQIVDRVKWYDPQQQTLVEIAVPKEEIILIGLMTY